MDLVPLCYKTLVPGPALTNPICALHTPAVLFVSDDLRLSISSGPFRDRFQTNILFTFTILSTCPAQLVLPDLIIVTT